MKIGFVQFAPVLGDSAATVAKLDRMVGEFKDADLVVLPELCNSGYNFASIVQARSTAEDAETGAFTQYLASLCRRHRLFVVAGINELDARDGCFYNTAVLIGPEGHIGKYRKLHLFLNEKDYFAPGNLGLPVFDLGVCKVGMLICFDWLFPEAWRVLALRGADIICHPANLVLPGLAQRGVPIHAVMNRIFVVTANRVGQESELVFTGQSLIADPKGAVLAQAHAADAQVCIADVDVEQARNKMITPRNHVLRDRRPEEYGVLTEPA